MNVKNPIISQIKQFTKSLPSTLVQGLGKEPVLAFYIRAGWGAVWILARYAKILSGSIRGIIWSIRPEYAIYDGCIGQALIMHDSNSYLFVVIHTYSLIISGPYISASKKQIPCRWNVSGKTYIEKKWAFIRLYLNMWRYLLILLAERKSYSTALCFYNRSQKDVIESSQIRLSSPFVCL